MSKNLDTKIREIKELRPDSSPGSPFVALARSTALAWAIMNELKAGRKVRCHKAAVDFFKVAVASEKLGNVLSVTAFA
jgi:hypothetical protein